MDLAHFLSRVSKPTVVTYHSDIVRQKMLLRLYSPLKQRFLRSVDAIVATSPNYMASSPVLERYRDKTRIITYGLDKSIYPAPDAERHRPAGRRTSRGPGPGVRHALSVPVRSVRRRR